MRLKNILFILAAALTVAGCGSVSDKGSADTLYVSILPLKNIVDEITGGDYLVEVLVPAGASPETYEPTPLQMVCISRATAIFITGQIDFEKALIAKIGQNTDSQMVDLSDGISLIAGECSHGHGAHGHGTDPHIWSSPKNLKQMALTAYKAIERMHPDSARYKENFDRFSARLDSLDCEIIQALKFCKSDYFIIYHPALTYYARDYGLTQVSLEEEGKEPSADKLKKIIAGARRDGITTIFYQRQFSPATVQAMASEMGARCIEIDPLNEDIVGNLLEITKLIAGK